jgi:putative flippase GtrA
MNKDFIKKFYPLAMFCTLGAINTASYFLIFSFFLEYLHLNYLLAVTVTYIITATFQFFSNRKFTFKSSGNVGHQLLKYFILLALNYLVTLFIMHSIVERFELSPYIGLCFATLSSATMSFLLFKFWVFRHPTAVSKELN